MATLVEELSQHQQELLPYTGPYLGKTNLDIGCGTGITSAIHREKLGVSPTLCDVADIRDALACAFPFSLIQDGKLSFPPQAFDSSYLQYVLHHLPSETLVIQLLAEAQRVSRRIIIVEEILGEHTDIVRAKAFDKEVNDRLHPGTFMPVHKYYTRQEIEKFFKQQRQKIIFHANISPGFVENGFLETQVFVAE